MPDFEACPPPSSPGRRIARPSRRFRQAIAPARVPEQVRAAMGGHPGRFAWWEPKPIRKVAS